MGMAEVMWEQVLHNVKHGTLRKLEHNLPVQPHFKVARFGALPVGLDHNAVPLVPRNRLDGIHLIVVAIRLLVVRWAHHVAFATRP